jgi:prepilin-type N-terminal cleavage/methylation domain-containing protein
MCDMIRHPERGRFVTFDPRTNQGFSLIELMIVLVVFGIVLSFGIPSFWRYSLTQQLRGTSENLAQTIQLQRARAMATGQTVTINFNTAAPNGWTVMGQGRSNHKALPRGITYASANPATLTLTRDGQVNTSAVVVLQGRTGLRDTVSIQVSGLTLVH